MFKALAILSSVGAVAMAGFGGYTLASRPAPASALATTDVVAVKQAAWAIAAIGRAEPRHGEIRIAAALQGRVVESLVHANDKVEEGEVLVRLEDDELRFRLVAAESEASVRRRERDTQPATAGREDVRRAEDALYLAERTHTGARFELDHVLAQKRTSASSEAQVTAARRRLTEAKERVTREKAGLSIALAKPGLPAPNRAEAAFTAARADVSVAEALLDKTRIRAPAGGTVLRTFAKVGEIVSPAAETPLIVMGDLSAIRVIAEVDEIDAAKVRIGQSVVVRSDSYPGRDFEGKVTAFAPALAPPRIGGRGPRRPTDVEVLEVTIGLDGTVPILTGMKTDVLFR